MSSPPSKPRARHARLLIASVGLFLALGATSAHAQAYNFPFPDGTYEGVCWSFNGFALPVKCSDPDAIESVPTHRETMTIRTLEIIQPDLDHNIRTELEFV